MAHNCENCKFRAHYDEKPNSLLGKFWRWHINFCPGWKGYFTSQSDEKKAGKEEQQYGDSVVSQLNTHHTPVNQKDNHSEISDGDISMPYDPKRDLENYHYPTIDLLKKYDYDGTSYVDMEEQNANKNRIVDTLRNFGIEISSIKNSRSQNYII